MDAYFGIAIAEIAENEPNGLPPDSLYFATANGRLMIFGWQTAVPHLGGDGFGYAIRLHLAQAGSCRASSRIVSGKRPGWLSLLCRLHSRKRDRLVDRRDVGKNGDALAIHRAIDVGGSKFLDSTGEAGLGGDQRQQAAYDCSVREHWDL